MAITPVVVSIPAESQDNKPEEGALPPRAHHKPKGGFINPWPSFVDNPMTPLLMWKIWQDWQSQPIPPPERLPQVLKPDWGHASATPSAGETAAWSKDIKSTWLGESALQREATESAES